MWKCMRKCPRFENCNLNLATKECSYPMNMYYKPNLFERVFGRYVDQILDKLEEKQLKQDLRDEEKYARSKNLKEE